ncbi:MAG: peroxiredoxin-like family protein [Cyanobacteriota bacterium]|nr:peroxiredoxin-like family protein [Cyanobacteriota bacterium]
MKAPAILCDTLATAGLGPGRRRLVLLLSQLGDFDSLEYAQALVPALPRLHAAGIDLLAIAIGDHAGADRFCAYTGLPRAVLRVEREPRIHRALGLYAGLQIAPGPWPGLLLMCAGVGSPGTLREVLRGYTGDRSAPQRLQGAPFAVLGEGFLRPFELASVRLRNMQEALSHWRTYVPDDRHLTQRGGTFLLDAEDNLLYEHRDAGLLGFSASMAEPLRFLEPWLLPLA